MGGKFGTRTTNAQSSEKGDIATFIKTVPETHRANFDELRALMRKAAPRAKEIIKWGTLQFDYQGPLFGLSVTKNMLNVYVLTIGLLAHYDHLLSGVTKEKCVLRFGEQATLPTAILRRIFAASVAAKNDT